MLIHLGQNGTQSGPFTTEEFLAKIADETVLPTDLAWTNGQDEWIPVAEFLTRHGMTAPPARVFPPTPAAEAGRFSQNSELLQIANERLAGKWWPTFGTLVLASLIGNVAAQIPCIGMIVNLLVSPVLDLGVTGYLMNRARPHETPPEIGWIFKPFKNFGRSLAIIYWLTLWVIIWALPCLLTMAPGAALLFSARDHATPPNPLGIALLIVGGIISTVALSIVTLRYALHILIALDNPDMPVSECLKESIRLMHGHKWRLWLLALRAVWAPMATLIVLMTALLIALIPLIDKTGEAAATKPPVVILAVVGLGMIPVWIWFVRNLIRYRVARVIFADERIHLDENRTGA